MDESIKGGSRHAGALVWERDDGGSLQSDSRAGGEKQPRSGYVLKEEPVGVY